MPTPLRRPLDSTEVAAAIESVVPLSAAIQKATSGESPAAVVIAWISDLHIVAPREYEEGRMYSYQTRIDASSQTELALREIGALRPRPDAIVLGGDICDSGPFSDIYRAELEEAKSVLSARILLETKVAPILGNHDLSTEPINADEIDSFLGLGREWNQPAAKGSYYYVTSAAGWRIIALDSRSELGDAQRDWLATELAGDRTTPTVILTHRPFVRVGNWVDQLRLVDNVAFRLVEDAPNVKLVLSGHTHKRRAWDTGRTIHAVFPACAYGIGDTCGWGVVLLDTSDVVQIYVKETAAPSWQGDTETYKDQVGAWAVLPIDRASDEDY